MMIGNSVSGFLSPRKELPLNGGVRSAYRGNYLRKHFFCGVASGGLGSSDGDEVVQVET